MPNSITDRIASLIEGQGSTNFDITLSSFDIQQVAEAIATELGNQVSVDGTGFMIDAYGRLYMDAIHVGWLRKQCGHEVLSTLADKLGAQLPSLLDDFKVMREGNGK